MAAPREALLEIEGMTCASCVARVEKRLQSVDGVTASVNLATEQARVTYPDDVDPAELVAAVRSAGYEAHVRAAAAPAPVRHRADHERVVHETDDAAATAAHEHTVAHEHDHSGEVAGGTTLRTRLIVSAALAVPVVATGMVPAWQFPGWQWVSLVLTTPIVLWGGWPFHRATFRGARHGALTMDTLITLGTFAAYLWSVWALIWGSAGRIGVTHEVVLFGPIHDATALVYFEVAAAVTVFLLLGRLIEQRSKRRAGAALRALLDLAAKDVEREDGTRVPVDALRPGDRFIVRPGEKIATDGIVRGGRAAVDESMMTGESVPVELAVDAVATGGTLVVDGRLVVEATAVGAETRLARIARLVEDAQAGKSRVQRLADRISGVFVPIVIALAVLTLIGWVLAGAPIEAGFVAAVAVLIIACPCALGLATPIAILVGTGRGAQRGVLITGPEAVEDAARVDTVVLDKTGTVTQGRMEVREVLTTEGTDAALMRRLVGSLEHASEHPLARAVTATADTLLPVTDFTGHAGHGVTGRVDGRDVFAGTLAFATGLADGADAVRDAVAAAQASGATTVVAGWDRRVRGVFAVADRIREDAADTVRALRARGIDVVLLTGDNAGAAAAVAREAGIDRVVAEVLPEDKVAEVRRLQAEGHRVAMVGDGVNDAAALATADVGIAMGGGTDAAMHAGDIALTGGGLGGVLTALTLSRRTMRVIRGNLFWAFAYNVAALPLAVLGLLNPMVAGAAMAFSSVFVVLNSLRLRRAV